MTVGGAKYACWRTIFDFEMAIESLEKLKKVLGEDNSEYKKMAGMISDAKMLEEY